LEEYDDFLVLTPRSVLKPRYAFVSRHDLEPNFFISFSRSVFFFLERPL
jgi:hypothetical protein